MLDEADTGGWADVDAAEDAATFEAYLDEVSGLAAVERIKARSHRLLRPTAGDRLLDVGCGTGPDVRELADAVGDAGTVVGVDGSRRLLGTARDRSTGSTAAFVAGDAARLGARADAFDGARTDRVLQHVDAPARVVAELSRVTRSGGRVVLTEPDWGSLVATVPGVDPAVTDRALDPTWACAEHPRIGRRLRDLLADAGLEGLEVDTGVLAFEALEPAESVLGFEGRVRRLREADPDDVDPDAWERALERAARTDGFFAALTLVTVAGRVP